MYSEWKNLFMKTPKVSVIIPSFNHGKYIAEAIKSVLNQTYTDFELLIYDDNSIDNSRNEINKFNDERIRKKFHSKNLGASVNTNLLIKEARGEYIALLNSDDIWTKDRLLHGISILENNINYGAVFSWAGIINEKGEIIEKNSNVFKKINRNREEWLYNFYKNGNYLCHPSLLIRREIYEKIGMYDLVFKQLPDFLMWINLVKHYDIYIIPEVLVYLRKINMDKFNTNTSAPLISNSIRDVNESFFILLKFFDNIPNDLFVNSFNSLFKLNQINDNIDIICEKFFVLLGNYYYLPNISYLAAFIYFSEFCNNEEILKRMKEKYNYSLKDFYELGSSFDLLNLSIINENNMNVNFESIFQNERFDRKIILISNILLGNKSIVSRITIKTINFIKNIIKIIIRKKE